MVLLARCSKLVILNRPRGVAGIACSLGAERIGHNGDRSDSSVRLSRFGDSAHHVLNLGPQFGWDSTQGKHCLMSRHCFDQRDQAGPACDGVPGRGFADVRRLLQRAVLADVNVQAALFGLVVLRCHLLQLCPLTSSPPGTGSAPCRRPPDQQQIIPAIQEGAPRGPWNPRPPGPPAGHRHSPTLKSRSASRHGSHPRATTGHHEPSGIALTRLLQLRRERRSENPGRYAVSPTGAIVSRNRTGQYVRLE